MLARIHESRTAYCQAYHQRRVAHAASLVLALVAVPSTLHAGTPGNAWFRPAAGGSVATAEVAINLIVGDVDGDGDNDVVSGHRFEDYLRVFLNDGNGALSPGPLPTGSLESFALVLVDVDGDGDLDIAAAAETDSQDWIWLNDGSGQFSLVPGGLPAISGQAITALDLDSDGDADLAIGGPPGSVTLLINQGGLQQGSEGQFAPAQLLGQGPIVRMLSAPDINADGLADLAVLRSGNGAAEIYLNQSGVLSPASAYPVINPTDFAFGRLDNDALPDFVIGQFFFDTAPRWYRDATPPGQFQLVLRELADTSVEDLELADLNGDGLDDLVVAGVIDTLIPISPEMPQLQIWLNFNAGIDFVSTRQCLLLGEGRVRRVELADMDGDGDPDLVALLQGSPDRVVVYLNGPSGLAEICCPAEASYFLSRSTGKAQAEGGANSTFDLSLYRRLRDEIMTQRNEGVRLVSDYQDLTPDMLAVYAVDPLLLLSTNRLLTDWGPNFEALLAGNGANVSISATQINPISFILDDFAQQGSPALAAVIANERARIGPLTQFIGMNMNQFADLVFGASDQLFADGMESP